MPDLAALQTRIGYKFRDEKNLRLALTHPSMAHDLGPTMENNQRLEYLGDAVLQLALTVELYGRFTSFDEGALTKARAKLVNRTTLGTRAQELDLGKELFISRGEEANGGRERISALADTYEALIGAIFIDSDYETARQWILREFSRAFGAVDVIPTLENPKGELQELIQETSSDPIEYHLASITGPDHDRIFESAVHHKGVELARGTGRSKKAAESEAALAALNMMRAQKIREPKEATKPKPGAK